MNDHSSRSVTIGSTRVARRAGTSHATTATSKSQCPGARSASQNSRNPMFANR
jgi:hypothetical protein